MKRVLVAFLAKARRIVVSMKSDWKQIFEFESPTRRPE